jgi:hypothetical protein
MQVEKTNITFMVKGDVCVCWLILSLSFGYEARGDVFCKEDMLFEILVDVLSSQIRETVNNLLVYNIWVQSVLYHHETLQVKVMMTVWGNRQNPLLGTSLCSFFGSAFYSRYKHTHIHVTFLSLHPFLSRRHARTHTRARAFDRRMRHSCLQDEVFFSTSPCSNIYLFNLIILHL